jgi:hypothetical protein
LYRIEMSPLVRDRLADDSVVRWSFEWNQRWHYDRQTK